MRTTTERPVVITICGKAGVGKDTAALLLQSILEAQNKKVLVVHFADLLKFTCKTFFGWDGNKDEAGRTLLQQVGTEYVRTYRPDYWTDYIGFMIQVLPLDVDYVIIPDLRFPNEYSHLLSSYKFPLTALKITRDTEGIAMTEEQKQHASETSLDDFPGHFSYANDSSVRDMQAWLSGEYLQYLLRLLKPKDKKEDL